MAKFNWEARSRTGALQKGVMEANTKMLVEAQLRKFVLIMIFIFSGSDGSDLTGTKKGSRRVSSTARSMAPSRAAAKTASYWDSRPSASL